MISFLVATFVRSSRLALTLTLFGEINQYEQI